MNDIVELLENLSVSPHQQSIIDSAVDEIVGLREEVVDLKDLIQSTVNYTGVSVSNQKYTFHKQTHGWYLPEETKNG